MSTRTIVAIALLASLGGCTLFGGGSKTAAASQDTDISSYFDERIAAGREFLVQGLPGRAVVAFRQASYHADHAAEAYNGLGVAYSMQGRPDVAREMFNKAVVANPYDTRFSRNLARLEKRLESEAMLAVEEASEGALAQADLATIRTGTDGELSPVDQAAPFTFPRTVTSSGGLSYREAKETHITAIAFPGSQFSANTDGLGVGPRAPDSTGVQTAQRATRNPSVTIFNPRNAYPVRVAITGKKQQYIASERVRNSSQSGKVYPVRVALGSSPSDDRN